MRLVGACTRRPWLVVALVAALAGVAIGYVAGHIAIDTDTAKLISADLPWRQREAAFDAAFPQRTDLIAIVIDASTPERAEAFTATLARGLADDTRRFRSVRRPDGGTFFDREGLLFSSVRDVAETTQGMIAAEPLLATLAADPSLRGVMDALALMLEGAKRDRPMLPQLAAPLAAMADAFEAVLAARPTRLSWRALIAGGAPDPRELRRFILVQPVLDYGALESGASATHAIRERARTLGLDIDPRVRVRLTGPVPLADEELATLSEGAGLDATLMVVGVVSLLWLALRSARLVVAVLATLVAGLVVTAAFGLLVFGRFNLISVAFAVLFIGLGVDFGIQYCVRYRELRFATGDLRLALHRAAEQIGGSLALAALSTAVGFFAFVPTEYRGVSELGVIAGTGMLIALVASVTLLPALLVVLRAPREDAPVGYRQFAPLDAWLRRNRRRVLVLAAIVATASLALVPRLHFDFNPLNLKSRDVESVATLLDLMRDPSTTPNTIDIVAPTLPDAVALAQRISQLPEVDHALTLASFVPQDQDEKLTLIDDAALLLDPVLHPARVLPPPHDAQTVLALRTTATALAQAAAEANGPVGAIAARLAAALQRLAETNAVERQRAHAAFVPGLLTLLGQLRAALGAERVTLDTLPADLVHDWVARDGRARIEVFPKGGATDNATLVRFVDAVRRLAPDATGAPISIQESSRTIVRAFVEAGLWAFVAITLLLAVTLRHVTGVLLTLAPLLLSGLVTLALCALAGFALNFENIIAMPLLLGIGVAFDIYFIMAWRAGMTHLLESSLTRGVLFSALTTGVAFGTLWLSHHPGTSSMGKLLALSLASTLAAVLLVLPALLRTVRSRRRRLRRP